MSVIFSILLIVLMIGVWAGWHFFVAWLWGKTRWDVTNPISWAIDLPIWFFRRRRERRELRELEAIQKDAESLYTPTDTRK